MTTEERARKLWSRLSFSSNVEDDVEIIMSALADAHRAALEQAAQAVESEKYLGITGITNLDVNKWTVSVNYVHGWMENKLDRIAAKIRAAGAP